MTDDSVRLRGALAALRRLTTDELDVVGVRLQSVRPDHEALRGLTRDELAVVAEWLPFIRLDVARKDVKAFGEWCDRNAGAAVAGYESLWRDEGDPGA